MGAHAPIRAAGVVVVDQGGALVLVRRARRADISLPKGKLDRDEPSPAAAVRECHEETGLTVRLGVPLGTRSYHVEGVPKTVDYWRAVVVEDTGFVPGEEIAEVLHRPVAGAVAALSYPEDADLVQHALALPPTVPFVVLRHASATSRHAWAGSGAKEAGDDDARPLAPDGLRQADRLVALLAAYGVHEVLSSSARRCRQTVAPYASEAGLHVRADERLSEPGHARRPEGVADAVRAALDAPEPTVLCTHRPVLHEVVRVLAEQLGSAPGLDLAGALDPHLATAAMLVLHRDPHGRVVAVEHHRVD